MRHSLPQCGSFDGFTKYGKAPRTHTALVVDDEAGSRESLRLILEPHYRVLTADAGELQRLMAAAQSRTPQVGER